jgi:Domain of unknown function (DUF5666)
MKKYKVHIVWVIVAIVALVAGIFWGKAMTSARGTGTFAGRTGTGAAGAFAGRGGAANGGLAMGSVTAIDSQSITLQLANGNSENVFYSSSTPVIVPQAASISSITPGTNVIITGTQNSDGSLTAQSIQVRNESMGVGTGK